MLGSTPDEGHPWSGERAVEIYDTFENIIAAANDRHADFLIIAGNLFAHVPGEGELEGLDEILGRLHDTRVIYAAGELDRLGAECALLSHTFARNVYVIGKDEAQPCAPDIPAVSRIRFENEKVCICGMSRSGMQAMDVAWAEPETDDGFVNIFVCCAGGAGHVPSQMRELKRAGFAYAALGGRDRYASRRGDIYCYSGSPEALGPGGIHGYVWGEIEAGKVRAELVPISKRQYKTIHFPVNNYTGELELVSGLLRMLDGEGRDNIYTINIARAENCEKSFELSGELENYRILAVNGDKFERSNYSEYEAANRKNEFGRLLGRLAQAGLSERESVKLAVDWIIDMSGLYKRKNKKMSNEMYRDTRRQVLACLAARRENYENDEDMKAYESAKREYDVSCDVMDELGAVWANERQTELAIRTVENKLAELPRRSRRWRVRIGVRSALIPLILIGLLSVILLPSITDGTVSLSDLTVLRVTLTAVILTAAVYYAGYYVTKTFGAGKMRKRNAGADGAAESLRQELSELEQKRAVLYERRNELQMLDRHRREMKEELTQKEKLLEDKRYELELMRAAIDVLSV